VPEREVTAQETRESSKERIKLARKAIAGVDDEALPLTAARKNKKHSEDDFNVVRGRSTTLTLWLAKLRGRYVHGAGPSRVSFTGFA